MTARHERTDLSRLRRRPLAAFLVGIAGVAAIALVGFAVSPSGRTGPALLLVLPVLLAAVVGGRTASLAVAVVAALAFATAFLPPIGSPLVRFADDALALAVFVVVAFASSFLLAVTLDAERRRRAADEARLAALEAVDEHRRALLRSVSHELRTPLGVVHGTATELLDGDVIHTASARRQLLSLLVEETGRLERIVANLLAMSRIDAHAWQAERELVDVGISSRARCAVIGIAGGTPVTVDVRPDLPPVYADPVQMDLVLANLLENAARHSPDGRPVTVVAERAVGSCR